MKSVQIRGDISGPYFPAFGLNTERYEVSLSIQSECGKIRTRINSIFFRRALANHKLHIYNVFDRYIYLRCIISKEHLQPYFWMVPSLFQKATCNVLVFSKVLCFFATSTCSHPFFKDIELISNSSCSHPFDKWPFLNCKRVIAASHSFKFTAFFAEQDL